MVERNNLIAMMVKLLDAALAEQSTSDGTGPDLRGTPTSPLVGAEAVVTSMGLVSFITDVESILAQDHNLELSLVSEKALSRKNSPFRTIETLAYYVLELAGAPDANGSLVENER